MGLKKASESERLQTIVNNYAEWGKALNLSQYQDREELLRQYFYDSLHTWVYTIENVIVAQCETYEDEVEVYYYDEHGKAITCKKGIGYGVASVFVPPEHRGKGAASQMMRELNLQLRYEDPNSLLSTLFSDIGSKFYSRFGWDVYSPISLDIDTQMYPLPDSDIRIDMIWEANLKTLIEDDIKILRSSASDSVFLNHASAAVIVLPTVQKYCWFRARSEIYVKHVASLKDIHFESMPYGHRVTHDEVSNWFIYFYDFKESVLFVLRHHVTSVASGECLMANALKLAKKCIFGRVEIWNPNSFLIPKSEERCITNGLSIRIRIEESLPSMVLFSESIPSLNIQSINWIGNEKYCWI